MKVDEIRAIARDRGLNPGKLKKAEIVRAIQAAEGNPCCFETATADRCGQASCLWRDDCN